MFNINGLVSGLDTASIIDSLVSLQENQVARLNEKKATFTTKQSAFKSIEARLLTLRSAMSRLNRSTGNVFSARSASSSDESLVVASASSGAQTGVYNVTINSLATAHQIGSAGFNSLSSNITQGEFSIQLGDGEIQTITIDDSNDTVTGFLSEINSQVEGVKATTILDQGTGNYRILLTAEKTGTDNAINITNNLAASDANSTQPDFSGPAIQQAANASVTIGQGPGAITAEYQTNRVDGLIDGVTLQLANADASKHVTIAVQQDNDSVVDSVQQFVDSFNSVVNLISDQTRYVAETEAGGPLLGNRAATNLQNRLRSLVVDTVPGLGSNLNRLSRLGIEISDSGTLTFNSADLEKALNGELAGVSISDVNRMFGMTGESTNSNVEFLLGSSRTEATTSPIQVDITQAAEQAKLVGDTSLANSIVIDNTNNQLMISIDGSSQVTLNLAEGTYSQEELATHLESVINSSSELGSRDVTVSIEGGSLAIQTVSYGSASQITELDGTALAALGISDAQEAEGKDVVGRFVVNGKIETAVGRGRILTGQSDNETTADVQVRVTFRPDQITASHEAELSITRGATSRIDEFLSSVLDPEKGILSTVDGGFNSQIESIEKSIDRVESIATAKREALLFKFAALERSLAQLQTTSSFLGGQISSFGQG
ncbi:MAG: flagellar filament capping protein FliD [Pirellulaceae bacterium]